MCDPITLALGAAATGAGSFLNAKGDKKVARAQQAAIAAEEARQAGFRNEAAAEFDAILPQFTKDTQEAGIQQAGDDRTASILANVTESPLENFTGNVSSNAPRVVQQTIAQELLAGLDKGKQRARGLGKLGAFNEQNFANSLALAESGRNIGTVGNFARQSAGILPGEVAGAERARGSGVLADLFSGAGQLGLTAGITGQGFDDKLKGLFASKDTGGGISRGFKFGGF